jgi:hypothetical protein
MPHHILGGDKPVVLIFADQNFVPFLSHDPENCIAVVRLENPSLSELVDIAGELLDRFTLPEKSILLFGSGSHLFRGGGGSTICCGLDQSIQPLQSKVAEIRYFAAGADYQNRISGQPCERY